MTEGQVGGRSIEVGLRGGLDPIGQVAVVDLVQVQLEDFVLGIATGDLGRQQDLANLAQCGPLGAFLGGEQQVAGNLLGDGRGSRDRLSLLQVLPDGASDRGRVEPRVAVEARVLGRDDRGQHVWGDLFQRHIGAAPRLRIQDLVKQIALPVQNAGCFELGRVLLQIPDRGQGSSQGVVLV